MPNGQGEPEDWPDWTGLAVLGCKCVEPSGVKHVIGKHIGMPAYKPKPGKTGWGGSGLAAYPTEPDPDCPLHGEKR